MIRKKFTVYHQLVLLFISIVLPFILIGMITLFISNQHLKTNELESRQKITNNVISSLDSSLENIYISCFMLFDQTNIRAYSDRSDQLSDYEKIYTINTIRDQLTSINQANPLIEHLRIYFKNTNRVYNSAGHPAGSFQDVAPEDYENLVSLIQRGTICNYSEDHLSIFAVPNLLSYPNMIIEAEISYSELKQHLQNLLRDTNDSYFLSLCKNDFQLQNLPDTFETGILNEFLQDFYSEHSSKDVSYKKSNGFHIVIEELPFINGIFFRVIPDSALIAEIQLLTIFTSIFIFLILSASIIFFIFSRHLIHQPLSELISGFTEIENGNYDIRISCNRKNEFSYLYRGFNKMAMNLKHYIDHNYQMNMLLHQAELKQLQAQINPHFLYNSFFMLQSFIKSDLLEDALEVTTLLGKYFQYITRNANTLVPLIEEYTHTQVYCQIQEKRFENRIQVTYETLPEDFSNLMVPKLILQPLLENAYNYGLKNKAFDGILHVHCQTEDNSLQIFVEDNGESLSDSDLEAIQNALEKARRGEQIEMSGMLNICRRLNIFSDNNWNLQVSRSTLGGLCVSITLYKENSL